VLSSHRLLTILRRYPCQQNIKTLLDSAQLLNPDDFQSTAIYSRGRHDAQCAMIVPICVQSSSEKVSGILTSNKVESTTSVQGSCCASRNRQLLCWLVNACGVGLPNHFNSTPSSAQACTKRWQCAASKSGTRNCKELPILCALGNGWGRLI